MIPMEKTMEDDAQTAREDAEFQAREERMEAAYRRQNAMEMAIKLNGPGGADAHRTVENAKLIYAFLSGD